MPVPAFSYNSNGATVSFTNTSTGALSYLWKFGDGTTSTNTSTSHTYPTSGNYAVTLVAYNDCGADSVTQNITITIGGIDDNLSGSNIMCSPNPNNGSFNLILSQCGSGKINISILTLTGQEVLNKSITIDSDNMTLPVNISEFGKGVYYLHLSGKDVNVIRKIVVE